MDSPPGSLIVVDASLENSRFLGRTAISEDRTNWTSNSSSNYVKIPKILFPSFDGTNPRNWIRKCSKYFNLNPMDDKQKLDMVIIHLEGKADTWFYDYQESNLSFSWDHFVLEVCSHFLEVGHENIIGEFNKLNQIGTVEEYQEQFEELKPFMITKFRTLDEEYFTMSFISGLKEEITKMVKMLSAISLKQAIYITKMQ